MTDSQSAPGEHAPVLEATEARQGRRGKHVLWILVVSLVLVVLALFGAWAARAPDLQRADPNGTSLNTASTTFNAPEPSAKQTDVQKAPGVPGETSPASPATQTR